MSKSSENTNKSYSKLLRILLIILIVILIAILVIRSLGAPYDRNDSTYTKIIVTDNDTSSDIAGKLEDNGIIKNKNTFEFLSSIMFCNNNYKPGTYYLSPSMSFSTLSNALINGISTRDGFELPEGLNIYQTAELLDQAGYVDKDTFILAAQATDFSDFDFIDDSIQDETKVEGFLLPGSYDIDKSANETMIITSMLNEFDNNFTDVYRARAEEMGLSIREVVIVASIIELETTDKSEKAQLASVIYNRINLGMKVKGYDENTPLCSPSLESIQSALYPEENDYLYYVLSDKLDGTHKFAKTENKYNKLKAKYKKALKEKDSEDK